MVLSAAQFIINFCLEAKLSVVAMVVKDSSTPFFKD